VFDESSARKRINSLYEYDVRRELIKQGKLRSLPLQPITSRIMMLRSMQFAMFYFHPSPHSTHLSWAAGRQLFRMTAQRVTTQRPSLSFVGLDVSRLGTFYFPPQDAYHLLQHRLSLAQRKKLQPAPIATLALLTPWISKSYYFSATWRRLFLPSPCHY